jgi:seryl-tRNA synthetase
VVFLLDPLLNPKGNALLDVAQLIESPADTTARLLTKGVAPALVTDAVAAVLARRKCQAQVDASRAELNQRSREIGQMYGRGEVPTPELRAATAALKSSLGEVEAALRLAVSQERDLLLVLPNLPSEQAPVGQDETANIVVRYEGPPATPVPGARPHWEIAADLGLFDPARAAKLSGSGFSLLRGQGARLLRALVQFGLDLNRDSYEELVVPHFVRRETMMGTGHLPKFEDDAYSTVSDDLWAIPTGEVPLTAMHRDEILDAGELPLKYMTHTACFRREAGSAGKDTRGLQRLHEFHKVELVRICRPEDAQEQFDELLADAELTLQKLRLPYRVVDLCTGDLTFSSARIFDLEVYAPGVDRWLEVSSVGHFTDFQARRSSIRFRDAQGKLAPVHTLNGSALATPRIWAALLEHGQMNDGRVRIPDVLVPYMGGEYLEPPAKADH